MGIFFALLSAFGFSVSNIILQKGMKKTQGDNGVFTTMMVNVVILLVIFIFYRFLVGNMIPFNVRGFLFFILAGFLTTFMGRVSLFSAIRRIGSSRSTVVKSAAPLFTVLFAFLLIGEKISWLGALGIFLIIGSLFFHMRHSLVALTASLDNRKTQIGFLLALLAAVSFGLGHVARKEGILYYADPIVGSLIGSLLAIATFTGMELFRKNLQNTVINNFRKINYYFLAAGLATSVGQFAFFLSIQRTEVSYSSSISSAEPVLTVLLARLFLNKEEKLDWQTYAVAFLVFVGVALITAT